MMARVHAIVANQQRFTARTGESILDAALNHGVPFPHDCRAGRCGTCTAKVVKGVALGGETGKAGFIHACQARALGDLTLEYEAVPALQTTSATVAALVERGPDVVEVGLHLSRPMEMLPGQYCKFRFKGFPDRSFSPTHPADGSPQRHDVSLHVRRVRNGRVSMALGRAIRVGHRVRVTGPYGHAYLRPKSEQRLVLIAGGTGYAPILTIAKSALKENPERRIAIVCGARSTPQLYMVNSLIQLLRFPGTAVTVTADVVEPEWTGRVQPGSPADHLPDLGERDIVYAAGAPAMVSRLAEAAESVGADFYSDPFEASGPDSTADGLLSLARGFWSPRASPAERAQRNGQARPLAPDRGASPRHRLPVR